MENKNFLTAILLSMVILMSYQYFYEIPRAQQQRAIAEAAAQKTAPTATTNTPIIAQAKKEVEIPKPVAVGKRYEVQIENPRLKGAISLRGGRIDKITLKDYNETADLESPPVTIFSPAGTEKAAFAEFGWIPTDNNIKVPNADTLWRASQKTLTAEKPLVLRWENGRGLLFEKEFSIDKNYMLTVTERVKNKGRNKVALYPYGFVSHTGEGTEDSTKSRIIHEGMITVVDGSLTEIRYKDLQSDKDSNIIEERAGSGWLGMTDKYWMSVLIPSNENTDMKFRFTRHKQSDETNIYQADFLGTPLVIGSKESAETSTKLFVGAKETSLINRYAGQENIERFDLSIDFGWFHFLTKPMYHILSILNNAVGSFGLALILLTVLVRGLLFPLANKSYRSMARMKKLAPKMKDLKERHKDDKEALNKALMALYQKEKVNPAAGCLPLFIQMPVFFALYKVLFVSIEMRHAPFIGWISDLSAPDPTNIFNLFGLLPFDPPSFLALGAWPIIMGTTMYLQQKLGPKPGDPTQAKVMGMLPIVFTFLLGSFPAGLVIYWSWSNLLSILQQWFLLKKEA
ncbi:MAG: membrane protein insertase YidC [Alphaproteobacteria bacterium]